ncbi:carbohydrate ABC transporter permease [Streptomyces bobili]|uniref:carbohydrate ABC transporter permease n=1 Tax=Streptomyces bobili TaxID=67280 RepID=UPI00371ABA9D
MAGIATSSRPQPQAVVRRRPAVRAGRKGLREITRVVLLTTVAVGWIGIPLWLLLVNSVKPLREASVLGLGLPKAWSLTDNYSTVIHEGRYGTAVMNSVLIAVPTIASAVLLGSLAAWAYARSCSTTMKFAYNLTVLSILLPPAVLPTIYELQLTGLDGTRLGYFLVMTGTRLGTVVFLATGFIRAMPAELEDAAEVDGAGRLQIYRHLILPLLLPVLLVGSMILIITIWNEFFFAAFLLQGSERATLPMALYQFASASPDTSIVRWNLIFAHVVLTSLPLVIAYLFVQRRIVSGLSEGAIKG